MAEFELQTRRLTYPAPHSEAEEIGNGKYFHRPWTVKGVKSVLEVGGYFIEGKHSFENRAAYKAAFE